MNFNHLAPRAPPLDPIQRFIAPTLQPLCLTPRAPRLKTRLCGAAAGEMASDRREQNMTIPLTDPFTDGGKAGTEANQGNEENTEPGEF